MLTTLLKLYLYWFFLLISEIEFKISPWDSECMYFFFYFHQFLFYFEAILGTNSILLYLPNGLKRPLWKSHFITINAFCLSLLLLCHNTFVLVSICKKFLFLYLFFSLPVSLYLRCASCKPHIVGFYFVVQFDRLCALTEKFSPLTINVITKAYLDLSYFILPIYLTYSIFLFSFLPLDFFLFLFFFLLGLEVKCCFFLLLP